MHINGMRISLIFLFSVFVVLPLSSQIIITADMLNLFLQTAGESDTIAYQTSGDSTLYFYQGRKIKDDDFKRVHERAIIVWYDEENGFMFKESRFSVSDSTEVGLREEARMVRTHACDAFTKDEKIIVKNYKHGVQNGRSVTLGHRTGRVLEEGYYAQMDSVWQDTVFQVNPKSYNKRYNVFIRDKYPVKVGKWLYYNGQGGTIKIEEYPK